MCNGNVEISRIKVLNLTHFSHFLKKVTLCIGSQYYNIYQNCKKNCFRDKVSLS